MPKSVHSSTPKPLKFSRVAPGFYEAKTRTTFNGRTVDAKVGVFSNDLGWLWTVQLEGVTGEHGGDDVYVTKREAVEAVSEAVGLGWQMTKWGVCLA